MHSSRNLLACALLLSTSPLVHGQAFDCVILRHGNTDTVVEEPDFCKPPDQVWCNCAKSAFSNPVKGEASGFQQALMQLEDNRGIGNYRVAVDGGTLDLSGVQVGDVIGDYTLRGLGASAIGFPLGTVLVTDGEVKVTAVGEASIDFDINITFLDPFFKIAVRFDPTDEMHSFGHLYSGRLTSHGPGQGFTTEMRFAVENVVKDGNNVTRHAGTQVSAHCDPGFSTRFLLRWFTTETGIYTLPGDVQAVNVKTTMRRFDEGFDDPPCNDEFSQLDNLPFSYDEIFDLGTPDLLEVLPMVERSCDGLLILGDAHPGKVIDEVIELREVGQPNSPPNPVITPVNGANGVLLVGEPAPVLAPICVADISVRGIFSAINSDDGDGGYQIHDFAYEWFIASGPDGGADLPDSQVDFKQIEIEFIEEGTYGIGLRIMDGGAANNTAETVLEVYVQFDPSNRPPTAVISTVPAPPELELLDGVASIVLDGTGSLVGPEYEKDLCGQFLDYFWSEVDGPGGADILFPTEPITTVEFVAPGIYTFELEVDDLQAENSTAAATVVVTVGPLELGGLQTPGDCNQDGRQDVSDAVCLLGHLFTGDPATLPCHTPGFGGVGVDDPANKALLDLQPDGAINIGDPVYLLNYLFAAGPRPGICVDTAESECKEQVRIDGCPNVGG